MLNPYAELLILCGVLPTLMTGVAEAHDTGIPAAARPLSPERVGILVDSEYTFTWEDGDEANAGSRIDWFYSSQMPPTFAPWVESPQLEGTPIVSGILAESLGNRHTWLTGEVPSGSYWLWSRSADDDSPTRLQMFSPGVVTVAHDGDPIHPAIMLVLDPDGPTFADASWSVRYASFDPDGSGRVRLEATIQPDGSDLILLADDLEAAEDGRFDWDTADVDNGYWLVKATLTDARGLSFYAWGPSFVLVSHLPPDPESRDAGSSADVRAEEPPDVASGEIGVDAAGSDLGASEAGDDVTAEGCGCSVGGTVTGASSWMVLAVVCLGWAWRRRPGRMLRG